MSAFTLNVLHHVADGEVRRVGDEEVNMVRSNLPCEDRDVNLGTEPSDKISDGLSELAHEHPLSVFGYPDQVHLQIVFSVTA